MGVRGAIAQDQVLALFGTTAWMVFKATDFYTYTVVLTDIIFAFFPALICWSVFRVFWRKPNHWFGSWSIMLTQHFLKCLGGSWSGY